MRDLCYRSITSSPNRQYVMEVRKVQDKRGAPSKSVHRMTGRVLALVAGVNFKTSRLAKDAVAKMFVEFCSQIPGCSCLRL
jgi:hypothetical protein